MRASCCLVAAVWLGAAVGAGGCRRSHEPAPSGEAEPAPRGAPEPAPLPSTPWKAAAIAHGGVGSPPEMADGCRTAVDAALAVLERGGDAVDAAVAGVVVLEDDPRYNAGTGSRVRIDGVTVQMDAAVMRSGAGSTAEPGRSGATRERFGAVAVIEQVKNPVLVARAVMDTPHILIAGDGATRLARALGMPVYDPATDEMRAKTAEIVAKLRRHDPDLPASWTGFDWRGSWNFERSLAEAGLDHEDVGGDTVGVAVRTADGEFAVALSTGGTSVTLRGRVGDVPILGAGLYAGRYGAIAATGTGERIVEASLTRRVHDRLAAGASVDQAAGAAVDELRDAGYVGVIVIGARDMIGAADRQMAWAARELGSDRWLGPEPASPPQP